MVIIEKPARLARIFVKENITFIRQRIQRSLVQLRIGAVLGWYFISAGDDGDSYSSNRNIRNGQWIYVTSKTATSINIATTPLITNITGYSRRLYQYDFNNFSFLGFDGLTVQSNFLEENNPLVEIKYAHNIFFRNLKVVGKSTGERPSCIQARTCVLGEIDNCSVYNSKHIGAADRQGYGFHLRGIRDFMRKNSKSHNCKSGEDVKCQQSTREPISQNYTCENCESYDCEDKGFGSHPGVYNSTYTNCVAYNCGNFATIRGNKNLIKNCSQNGVIDDLGNKSPAYFQSLIRIGEPNQGGPDATYLGIDGGEDLVIEDCNFNPIRQDGQAFTSATDRRWGGLIYSYSKIKNLTIKNTTCSEMNGHGIFYEGDTAENVVMDNVDMNFRNQVAGKKIVLFDSGIDIVAALTGTNEFKNSTINNPIDASAPLVKVIGMSGSVTEGNNTVNH